MDSRTNASAIISPVNTSLKGFIAILIGSFLYSAQAIIMRLVGTGFGNFSPFAIRGLVISTLLLTFMLIGKRYKRIEKRDMKWFLLMPVFGVLTFVTIFIAINNLAIGTVLFVHFATFAVSGFIFGYFVFRETASITRLASLALCIAGLLLIFSVSFSQDKLLFFILAFVSGLGNTGWYFSSKKISSKYSYSQLLAIDSFLVFLICLFFAVLTYETIPPLSLTVPWLSILGLIIVSLAAYLLTVYGFRHLQTQVATLLLLLEVVFGPLLALLFFKEVPAPLSIVGGTLIFAGVALLSLSLNTKDPTQLIDNKF